MLYSVGGTATNGSDYTALSGSVVIPAGATTADITVSPVDDALVEWTETVTVSLTADGRYTVGSPSSATVSITESDFEVEAVTVPGTGIRVDWPDAPDETGYRVLRSTAGTNTWTEIGMTTADVTTFTDSTAVVGTTYLYRVVADSSGAGPVSADSEPAKAVTAEDDEDGDSLSNLDEYNLSTEIFYFDTDGDLLADGWEVQYGLDPLNSDQDGNGISDERDDFDVDTLNNLQESYFRSDPYSSDTDGDDVSDAGEVGQGRFRICTSRCSTWISIPTTTTASVNRWAPLRRTGWSRAPVPASVSGSRQAIEGDGITDFADFAGISGGNFVPLVVTLTQNVQDAEVNQIELTFIYDGSDPTLVTGSGTTEDPYVPGPSTLRIWKQDASAPRSTIGDYILPGVPITARARTDAWRRDHALRGAGCGAAAALPITIAADITGGRWSGTLQDTVHVRPIGVDLDVDFGQQRIDWPLRRSDRARKAG